MKSITANWFICRIRYDKTMENGMQKKVTESYIIDALSFANAETRITEVMSTYINGEFEVAEIDRAIFNEIFINENGKDDKKWYKTKIQFITCEDKAGRVRRANVYYLVEGDSLESARKNIDDVLGKTMFDYSIVSVSETPIIDVYQS